MGSLRILSENQVKTYDNPSARYSGFCCHNWHCPWHRNSLTRRTRSSRPGSCAGSVPVDRTPRQRVCAQCHWRSGSSQGRVEVKVEPKLEGKVEPNLEATAEVKVEPWAALARWPAPARGRSARPAAAPGCAFHRRQPQG